MKFKELKIGQVFKDRSGSILQKTDDHKYNFVRDRFWNIVTPHGTPESEPIERDQVGYAFPIDIKAVRIKTAGIVRKGYVPQPVFVYKSVSQIVNFWEDE